MEGARPWLYAGALLPAGWIPHACEQKHTHTFSHCLQPQCVHARLCVVLCVYISGFLNAGDRLHIALASPALLYGLETETRGKNNK